MKWLKIGLDDWAQRTVANGSFSTWILERSGVLQESSLRQILFNIFINNLEKTMKCTLNKSAVLVTQIKNDINKLE